ncbi:ABC-type tungstate transport system, periplasmic component [Desulfuromonas soudanensis]|uniref:ABC-type tungstate transport system, periplasmic component n=1 Tax=Desulfuromonas soudanensis TaxID=1603606 RepID=A0A0M5IYP8_9BACT|nr:ABC transporter permease [Desulfuromonas soudanensis]ALC15856.1 ABC-type tungstate transport system, periplasmic component [Desulfuromonas soudanensis]
MGFLFESFQHAISLILSFDREVFDTVWTSLYTSTVAILLAAAVGVPFGTFLGLGRFPGKRAALTLLNTLMALPTVVVGLVLFGLFSRQGPLGSWGFLFTPMAMIAGQMVLATPIVANYTVAAVAGADPRIMTTALTLGASRLRAMRQLLVETRFGIVAAIVAGFGRVIAEVGVAMMLGGNIRGYTRTMTTAIALETSKGEFAFGLALGIVLLAVALVVNLFLNLLQQR